MRLTAHHVERLVALRAEASAINKQLRELENRFKAHGYGDYASAYHVVHVRPYEAQVTNYKELCEDLNPTGRQIQEHTDFVLKVQLSIDVPKKQVA